MNRYPLWKNLLVLATVVIGFIYALPNIYAPDPAIQVTGVRSGVAIDEAVMERATEILDQENIRYFGVDVTENTGLIRFYSQDDQFVARRLIQTELGPQNYVVAFNRAATTPDWLVSLGAQPMNLGLDLSGGVHFLLEVDTAQVLAREMESVEDLLRRKVREENLRGVNVRAAGEQITVTANTEELREQMMPILRRETPELTYERMESGGEYLIRARFSEAYINEKEGYAVQQNLTTLRNRVNEIGVSEPLVQTQGSNRIVVQLPGIQDTARAKNILGKTANLEFRLAADASTLPSQREEFEYRSPEEQALRGSEVLERKTFLTGERVTNAQVGFDPDTGFPQINITLDSQGATLMHHATRDEVGRQMGIVLIEYDTIVRERTGEDGQVIRETEQVPNPKLVSFATIQSALGKNFRITGQFTQREASEMALLIRSGALAAPMSFVEETTIGPSLGAENIALGIKSIYIGLALVVLFMLVYYKVFGLIANIALALNIVLLSAIMSLFGATLTMPGIAGIVLTMGMAVDANVLIFSRIREELKNGAPAQLSIRNGFDGAFSTIMDANATTFIVAIILYMIGTGPIKGFAVTLAIGIVTSVFTAIMGTRALVNLVYGGRKIQKLWI